MFIGNILTGIFAQKSVAAVDGTLIEGGGLDGNWNQVGIQLIDTLAGFGWSFVVTFIILYIINKIPGLHLRADLEAEEKGLDEAELGENMYQHVKEVSTTVNKFMTIPIPSFTIGHNGNGTKIGNTSL